MFQLNFYVFFVFGAMDKYANYVDLESAAQLVFANKNPLRHSREGALQNLVELCQTW